MKNDLARTARSEQNSASSPGPGGPPNGHLPLETPERGRAFADGWSGGHFLDVHLAAAGVDRVS